MLRKTLMTIGILTLAAGTAIAQETTGAGGAGRVEVTAAPIGGLFFVPSSSETEPKFRNYGLGAAVTGNINRWVGIEGDMAFAVGMKQDVTFNGSLFADQKTPNMLTYSGNVVVNPWGSNRRVVPYFTGGAGALTMFNATDVENLGVTSNETFFTSNVGGGVRWFMSQNWGLRGDYRLFMIRSKDDAPVFFGQENRMGHRVSASLVFTY
jgi:Outer membrane protein beta-barrel domain